MKEIMLSDLTEIQAGHLAWRLDMKTGIGFLKACAFASGWYGNMPVAKIFEFAGKSPRSAKIHARKCVNFQLPDCDILGKPIGRKCQDQSGLTTPRV